MGFFDNITNGIKESHEKNAAFKEKQIECTKDLTLLLNITFGHKELNIPSKIAIRQKDDGTTYFGLNDQDTYRLVGYEWNGPIYENITTSNTKGQSSTTKKGKAGKMTAGALVGTMLFPGVGTAVGAAIGAGTKRKSNTINNSNTTSISKNVEQNGKAIVKLKKDGIVHPITIICNSEIDYKIRCFQFDEERTTSEVSKDYTDTLKGIKALKELLDIGAITQQEFDSKKEELLKI